MRSLIMAGNSEVRLADVAEPVLEPGEVLIATAYSALCGSELHGYRGGGQERGNSGHEAAGTIVALGEGVESLSVGQRVGVSSVVGCGACDSCARGQYTWCPRFRGYGSFHADRFKTSARACHLLPDDVPWDVGVLLTGDGLGVPYHTSTKITDPLIADVVVFGCGPIGLGNVLMQAHLGRRVIAVDLSAWRREAALRLGAREVIDPAAGDPVARVKELTGGVGADACLECAGRPETALACFGAVRTAGTVVFNGEQGPVPISPSEHLIRRDITAIGAWFYHFSEFPRMLGCWRNGLRVESLISHRFPAEQAQEAWTTFAAGQSGKVALAWSA
jgi:threonine dehydrogenase-like Zn-dependent dehydrogenase